MVLTADNYYTADADREYMSCSQYQRFCECEAKAMAILEGRWQEESREAFIVGNYFHTAMESEAAHEAFMQEHYEDIFKKARKKDAPPEKYAPYVQADKMIDVARRDPLIHSLISMPGENEKIITGELFGVPWRARLDKYVSAGRLIIDWKTVSNIAELRWSDELHAKVTFIDSYGYMMRAAVYTELEKQYAGSKEDASFIIVAISKQDYPDKEALLLNHRQRYDYELEQIKDRLAMIQSVKTGRVMAKRCGRCDYCRATKQLQEIRPYYTLMPEVWEGREDEYDQGTVLDNPQTAAAVGDLPAVSSVDQVDPPVG